MGKIYDICCHIAVVLNSVLDDWAISNKNTLRTCSWCSRNCSQQCSWALGEIKQEHTENMLSMFKKLSHKYTPGLRPVSTWCDNLPDPSCHWYRASEACLSHRSASFTTHTPNFPISFSRLTLPLSSRAHLFVEWWFSRSKFKPHSFSHCS